MPARVGEIIHEKRLFHFTPFVNLDLRCRSAEPIDLRGRMGKKGVATMVRGRGESRMEMAKEQDKGPTFQDLMQRIRAGDQRAAWELLDQYGAYLLHVIRQNLPARLRPKFDSTDFFQNVWASFFRQPQVFQRFDGPKDLLNYLRGMARNKLTMESRRRFGTAKYDVNRESSLDDVKSSSDGEGVRALQEPMDDRRPTPSYVAMVREQWDHWMARQSPQNQRVVDLRFRGASFDEIATELKINEKTARRVIESLVQELDPPPNEKPQLPLDG